MAQPTPFPRRIVKTPFRPPGDELTEEDLKFGPKDLLEDFRTIENHKYLIHSYGPDRKTQTNDGMWETNIHTISLGPMKFRAVDELIKLEEMRGDLSLLMVSRKYYYENDDYKHTGLFLAIIYEQSEENKNVDVVRLAGINVAWEDDFNGFRPELPY
jgi:hypothetical protein